MAASKERKTNELEEIVGVRKLVSEVELGKIIGVSQPTMSSMRRDGAVKPVLLLTGKNGQPRYIRYDLDAVVAQLRVALPAE